MRIRLYSKRNCPLCEVAGGILDELKARFGFELEVRYIEDSPADYAQYRYDVPLVLLDGEPAFRHHFTSEDVEKRLLASGMQVAETGDGNGQPASTRGSSEGQGGDGL